MRQRELAQLEGQDGAKQVIKNHASEAHFIPFRGGEVDVDTPDDFSRLSECDSASWHKSKDGTARNRLSRITLRRRTSYPSGAARWTWILRMISRASVNAKARAGTSRRTGRRETGYQESRFGGALHTLPGRRGGRGYSG